uniref:Tail completion protein n=1 Tax=Pseudomonas phage Pavpe01 TaxID=3138545 RepID=A0AAU6W0T0_9VIRU
MAGNLLDLAERLEKKKAAIETAASDAAVFVAVTIVADLAYKTPVDTSQALSSWIVTLDDPASIVGKAHYPGEKGSTQKASAAETIAAAQAALKNKKPGQHIFITNNQPYIKRLNDGYSKQQAAGFVERAALIGRKAIQRYKLKLK